jgi:hypothetical protein
MHVLLDSNRRNENELTARLTELHVGSEEHCDNAHENHYLSESIETGIPVPVFNFIDEAPKESNGECTKSLSDLQTLFFEVMDPEITFQESVDWTSRHSKMTWTDALTKALLDLKEIEKSGK